MNTQALIDLLRQDTRSGSTALAIKLLQALSDQLTAHPTLNRHTLEHLVSVLANTRPSMVVLANVLHRWQDSLGSCAEPELPADALNSLNQLNKQLEHAALALNKQARPLIQSGMTLMLHSRSSAVARLLTSLAHDGIGFDVILTQSLPGGEGSLLAQELEASGISCRLIHDAQMMLYMKQADLCLSGCDAWLSDGYFINKTGTSLQALAAREHAVPFWVLAESFKESPMTHIDFPLEALPSDNRTKISSLAFEPVACSLISGRASEQGLQAK